MLLISPVAYLSPSWLQCASWLGAHVTVFTSELSRMNFSSMICKSRYHTPPESSCDTAAASPASVHLALGSKARAHLPELIWSQPSCLFPIVIRMFTDLLFWPFWFHYHTRGWRVFCHMAPAKAGNLASLSLLLKLLRGICFKPSYLSAHLHVSKIISGTGTGAVYFVNNRPRGAFFWPIDLIPWLVSHWTRGQFQQWERKSFFLPLFALMVKCVWPPQEALLIVLKAHGYPSLTNWYLIGRSCPGRMVGSECGGVDVSWWVKSSL